MNPFDCAARCERIESTILPACSVQVLFAPAAPVGTSSSVSLNYNDVNFGPGPVWSQQLPRSHRFTIHKLTWRNAHNIEIAHSSPSGFVGGSRCVLGGTTHSRSLLRNRCGRRCRATEAMLLWGMWCEKFFGTDLDQSVGPTSGAKMDPRRLTITQIIFADDVAEQTRARVMSCRRARARSWRLHSMK